MRWSRLALLVLAGLSVLANDAQARYEGNLNLFVGQLWLTKGDWAPVEQQPELGLMLAFGEERAPIHVAIDVFASRTTVDNPGTAGIARVEASSREIAVGVRKVWDETKTRPHLGAGAASIQASETLEGPLFLDVNEDRAYGAWVDFGVTWRLASHLNLGLEARYSYALATLGSGSTGREVNAGGFHLGVLIGYGW